MMAVSLRTWMDAFRLRTLPLALSSILMGIFLAFATGEINWIIAGFSIMTTVFLQVLSNLANDFGDSENGADHNDRKGPSRTVQAGLISKNAMKKAIAIAAFLSLGTGLWMLYLAFGDNLQNFTYFLLLGLLSIVAAITYTVGKKPYGYAGLGDISVLIFFGFVGVLGSYFLQIQQWNTMLLLPAFSCGLFSVGVLNLNNIRDIESDQKAGKNSLPVRMGKKNAVKYHWILLLAGMASTMIYVGLNYSETTAWLFLISFPLFFKNALALSKAKSSVEVDPLLKQLALTTLLFVVSFGVGIIISTI